MPQNPLSFNNLLVNGFSTSNLSVSVPSIPHNNSKKCPVVVKPSSVPSPTDHISRWCSSSSKTLTAHPYSLQTKGNRSPTFTKLRPGTWPGKGLPYSPEFPIYHLNFHHFGGNSQPLPPDPLNSLRSQPTTKPCLSAGFRDSKKEMPALGTNLTANRHQATLGPSGPQPRSEELLGVAQPATDI